MPHSGNTTADPESVDFASDADHEPRLFPAFTLLASKFEPHRVGEVAILDGTGRFFLGRDGEALDAITFARLWPGAIEPTGPLAGKTLSNQQLQLDVDGDDVDVINLGRRTLYLNGKETKRARLRPDDVLNIENRWVLLFSMRAASIPKRADLGMHAFGEPDRFGIVGESPAIWELRERIAFVAQFDEHVLILGETGTGKELIAKAIHMLSRRARGPFIDQNSAMFPRELMVAQLTGNPKDWPNPGMPASEGLLGAARGGTLFLDEIGQLPKELQAALLRVLDPDASYQRLGDPKPLKADFRCIAATNSAPRDLKSDLAPRFQHRIENPPLDLRREDIPLLARALMLKAAAKSPEAASKFIRADGPRHEANLDPAFVAHLVQRDYPGNVRDLAIVLREAMGASRDDMLHATPAMLAQTPGPELAATAPAPTPPTEAEVRDALARHDGHKTRAAESLGITRFTLTRLLKKHGPRAA
ncbi:MAG TPA: sigma 54-interacting transcriptional regulator [Polyangiaceae bacterium]|jgi:DNA-binding NtrC family response regulator